MARAPAPRNAGPGGVAAAAGENATMNPMPTGQAGIGCERVAPIGRSSFRIISPFGAALSARAAGCVTIFLYVIHF